MRLLLTGVTGQVGGALAPRLESLATIISAQRSTLDLAKPQSIPAVLDRLAPDVIVNPAAYTAVDRAENEEGLAFRVNCEAPGVIARWAAARGVPLLHFSTDYVFSGTGVNAWREVDPADPISVYGRSKLAGEQAIAAAGGSFLILRTSWVYAATGKNFLRTIARLARTNRELRIVSDQIGAPTSAAVIADVVVHMLAVGIDRWRDRSIKAKGIVHVAAAGDTSWYEFALAIVGGLKERHLPLAVEQVIPITSAEYPTAARRPLNSRLDLTRLYEVFGVRTPHWQAALTPELDALATGFAALTQA